MIEREREIVNCEDLVVRRKESWCSKERGAVQPESLHKADKADFRSQNVKRTKEIAFKRLLCTKF